MTATLYVHLLGQFRLSYGAAPAVVGSTARLQSLLAYLIVRRHAPQPRQQIACHLWPDSPEAQARTNLRNLLHQLRQAWPTLECYLCADGQSLHWQPQAPVQLDVAEFESALARGAPSAAVALYGGELVPACYDEWILAERDRLRQLFITALQQTIQQLETAHDYAAAIAQAQRLLQEDPLRESIYRQLMCLHDLNGDRAAALRVYHTCATTLQRELAVGPSAPTQAVYARLVQAGAAAAAAPPVAAATALVGRQAEWHWLLGQWRAAAGGQPRLALLSGEAGIGKTRLAEELSAWAERQGMAWASARCYASESGLAYGPVVAWLRARPLPALEPVWRAEVARLLPERLAQRPEAPPAGGLTEAWQRERLYGALARAVLGQPDQPTLLVIEDVHWCDSASLEWLHYLLRFDAHARLLVLATVRAEERAAHAALREWLAALRHEARLEELELGPLTADETTRLAAQAAGQALPPALAAAVHRETEGNPFFVVELARAGLPDLAGAPFGLPPTVREVIASRLAQLSPAAHRLAGLAATIGRDFTLDVLRRADGGSEEALVRALDELWQRRIVREHGADAYDFTHDQLRAVAYAELSAARRRLLHRQVAEALAAAPAEVLDACAGQIAAHYEQAGQPGLAGQFCRRAAEAAQRVGAQTAAPNERVTCVLAEGGS